MSLEREYVYSAMLVAELCEKKCDAKLSSAEFAKFQVTKIFHTTLLIKNLYWKFLLKLGTSFLVCFLNRLVVLTGKNLTQLTSKTSFTAELCLGLILILRVA